ncbi:MAG: CBS domain-containing protein [Acidimicrobiales bacterium]
MQTDQILDRKGRDVATITPESPVRAAVDQLGAANVGALVVSPDGTTVAGILSERDVVRRLATAGPSLLDEPVSSIMQAEVLTCTGRDLVDDLMHRMTEHRIRHLPVVDDDGNLAGIISIGDVVKTHVDALETEREQLVDYIRTGR